MALITRTKKSPEVGGFSTKVEQIRLLSEELKKLQSLRDEIGKLPNCPFRTSLLKEVENLFNSQCKLLDEEPPPWSNRPV